MVSSQRALLVISEVYYPGWEAVVDGKTGPVYRVNHGLQGVLVEEGKHRVVVYYPRSSINRGLIISLVSLMVLIPTGFLWKRLSKPPVAA